MNNQRFSPTGAFALAVTVFFAFFSVSLVVSQAAPQRLAVMRPDPQPAVLPVRLGLGRDLGLLAGETRLDRMILLMKPTAGQQADLNTLLAAQQDPHSQQYHQWLTPAQFGARFGASAANLAKASAWLRANGFRVDEIPAGRGLIYFSGNAWQVEEAFHSPIHRFVSANGEHITNVVAPEIPASLSGFVAGVVSLNNLRRQSAIQMHKQLTARPQWNLDESHYVFPGDLAAIYDINPLYASGTTGAGVSIAIAGRSNILTSDVAAFRDAAALAANKPTVVLPDGNFFPSPGDQAEATLDVEWAGAIAPAAKVTLVSEESTATTDGVDLASAYIVNNAVAPVVSLSFTSCEQDMGASELTFYNSLWQQAAAQGMSVFVASGDSGVSGCDLGSAQEGTQPAVNGLCSSPYATCVGGTEFSEGLNPNQYWSTTNSAGNVSALGYIPETVWNESAVNGGTGLWASGGGISTVYPQPSWQQAVNGAAAVNGMRAVPDVSLTAAGHDGYIIVEDGIEWIVSGTSASTPSFAALMALVVQSKGESQGNANPVLYSLAESTSGTSQNFFHPTPSGNNDVPRLQGYSANGDTYNLATGLGSVDADLLVSNWGAPPPPPPTLTVAAQTRFVTVLINTSSTFNVTVATGGSFTGNIALSVTGLPQGVTASLSQTQLPSAGTVALTFAAGPNASAGSYQVTVQAQGDGVIATQQLSLAIDEPILRGQARPVFGGVHTAQ
ncbi:S53 family peptidase [Terracidiphilus gabretensis]|uniref:S53 family peptidase n=1 Tax=Terracidiphilus gabretensis TaxID=1577687 RepID=UPI00071B99F7|nr:S53 family peptidase [Terracidiphilus gabretensis]